MAFNLQTWKEEYKQRLPGWKKRLGGNLVYYFLAATAFVPIVAAVASGQAGAGITLGAALGGAVAADLLANMVERLRGKPEAEVAAALQAGAKADPELLKALDALLEKLDALKEAEASLAGEDKRWFVETIQKELAQLHSGVKYQAALVGAGAIAQGDHAIAMGQGAKYFAGDYVKKKVEAPDPRQSEKEKNDQARTRYLKKLRKFCQSLPLAAMGGEEGVDDEITLDRVYIALNTRLNILVKDLEKIRAGQKLDLKSIQAEEKSAPERQLLPGRGEGDKALPLPVLEAAHLSPRLALLGDPGAGKSTFVRNLLALQAAAMLGECPPLAGFEPELIPLYVVLRDLATRLNALKIENLSAERQRYELAHALRAHLLEDLASYGAQEFAEALGDALDASRVLLVLDGLDEVPYQMRLLIRKAVTAFIAEYNPARLILTSRIRSYTGEAVMPFPSFTIAPFDEEKISNFVQGWYNARPNWAVSTGKRPPSVPRTWLGLPPALTYANSPATR